VGTIKGYKMYVSYAVFAAEQVLPFYEKKYPNDDRPRKAIEAAKKCIDNPSDENKEVARAAVVVEVAAVEAAAWAAAAAAVVEVAAWAAAAARAAAAAAEEEAGADAKQKLQLKILEYGMKLLE